MIRTHEAGTLRTSHAGQQVTLAYMRDGDRHTLVVTLGSARSD